MAALILQTDTRGVATLVLNRPERHNAFDDSLISELTEALLEISADESVRAVVLRGNGKSFSAGADLDWMRRVAGYTEADNRQDAAALALLMHTLDRMPKPTIALVQGAAYGGGVGLVACCDIAIAAGDAKFSLSEVRLGLIPAVISPYVVAAIGPRQARRYFQSAEVITATRAREIGLVHEVVEPDGLADAAEAVLAKLLEAAPGAQAQAKDLVVLCTSRQIDEALLAETGHRIAAQRASAEGREGVSAFLEKRLPAWRQS
jgi:methylglutaconyl-CoA hydratase